MRLFMLYIFVVCSSSTLEKYVLGQELLNTSSPRPEDPSASVKNSNETDRDGLKQRLRETFSRSIDSNTDIAPTTRDIPNAEKDDATRLKNDTGNVNNGAGSSFHIEKKRWLETNELILRVFESLEQELDRVLRGRNANPTDNENSQSSGLANSSNGIVAAERSKWIGTNELILKVFESLENELGSLDVRVKAAEFTRHKLDRLTVKLNNYATDKSEWIKTNELILRAFDGIDKELDEIKANLDNKGKQRSRDGRTPALDGEDPSEAPLSKDRSASRIADFKSKWIQTNDLIYQVLEGVEKELNRLEMKFDFGLNGAARRLSELTSDIEKQENELNALREENDQLQTLARRHVVAVDGLEDDAYETEEKLLGKLKNLFSNKLKLDKMPTIDIAYRTGKFESGRPRRIKVKLVYESEKKHIMSKRKLLFSDKIYLNDDYTHYQYRNLMAIKFMKKDLDANKIPYTQKGDALKVKNRTFRAIHGVITDVTAAEAAKQAEQAKPIEPTHEKYLKSLLEP